MTHLKSLNLIELQYSNTMQIKDGSQKTGQLKKLPEIT